MGKICPWPSQIRGNNYDGEHHQNYHKFRAVTKTLQSSVIDTSLNLPPEDETVTIPAHQAEIQIAPTSEAIIGSSSEPSTIPAFLGEVKK